MLFFMLMGEPGPAPAAAAAPFSIRLVCPGSQDGMVSNRVTGSAFNSSGRWATGAMSVPSAYHADQVVRIEIDGTEGRAIQTSGKKWSKIKNVAVSDNEITADARLNLTHTAKIRIDRVSGGIEIAGLGSTSFIGKCSLAPPPGSERAF